MTASPRPVPDGLASQSPAGCGRPRAAGRFLQVGGEKLLVRGVTYGPFGPSPDEFPDRHTVRRDFALMLGHGINAIRTYTPPERWLLDLAQEHGLRVLVGLCAEAHAGILCDGDGSFPARAWLTPKVRLLAGHPGLLAYAVGNEIQAASVRWLGRGRVETYLRDLCARVRDEDPGALLTYANYPTTEFLELPFLDLMCFNVYLEDRERFVSYLARLHHLAGDRPLLIGEIGLDSLRHGEARQAHLLGEQVRASFASGCAGVFAYAWSDQWHRGGVDVTDWAFGLTAHDRRPKPALTAVARAYAEAPLARDARWPRISVVVCTFNGGRTIRDCLNGLASLDYPDYEVIVVDDGSTDNVPAIAAGYEYRVIRTENHGLSNARNTGIAAASGEIVAFIDDDARPDPHWLAYLASAFAGTFHVGVGGPNIPPAGDVLVADCVAASPGGPAAVLVSDGEAEHIPGCNMAFRKSALEAVGGFDARFRVAGDDVDICWRLMDRGGTLGYHPGAMVWHHSRGSVRAFWRQQVGYGRGEAMLERKWPERFNGAGQMAWRGRIYGGVAAQGRAPRRARIYQGIWGTAPYQFLYTPASGALASFTRAPEWYLIILALALLGGVGLLWKPLLLALPLAVVAFSVTVVRAVRSATRATFPTPESSPARRISRRALTAVLHLLQPVARLGGRLRYGLAVWRVRSSHRYALPWPRRYRATHERWRSGAERLEAIARRLRSAGELVSYGSNFDRWDLEVLGGSLGGARLIMVVEDCLHGCQLVRVRVWPRVPRGAQALAWALVVLAAGAGIDGAWTASGLLAGMAALLVAGMLRHAGTVLAALSDVVRAELQEAK